MKGKDIIVYGGASFDSSLIRAGLIDEFHLFINTVAIGNGMTIFKDLNKIQKFNLGFTMSQKESDSINLKCVSKYRPRGTNISA